MSKMSYNIEQLLGFSIGYHTPYTVSQAEAKRAAGHTLAWVRDYLITAALGEGVPVRVRLAGPNTILVDISGQVVMLDDVTATNFKARVTALLGAEGLIMDVKPLLAVIRGI